MINDEDLHLYKPNCQKLLPVFDRLKEINKLKDNWDSYGGKAPDRKSLWLAFFSLKTDIEIPLMRRADISTLPSFSLAPDGIVGFEWEMSKKYLFVRFYDLEKVSIESSFEGVEDSRISSIGDLLAMVGWLIE